MASQLRFEGGELEELLERVRTEVGPDARIVAANRIRQGGVAGFFAREGYEVVVDADGARRRRRRGVARRSAPTRSVAQPRRLRPRPARARAGDGGATRRCSTSSKR